MSSSVASASSGAVLQPRFARHLSRSQLLDPDGLTLVAVSGGLDSVCLLHLLRFGSAGRSAGALYAAHFDHALRTGSAADAAWVQGLCTAWSIPLVTERAVRPPRSEAAARDLRYGFLEEAARRLGAAALVTAHHADDQAETVLFRAARGTGITGLAGIPQRRGIIVRPLLPFTRAELIGYAAAVRLRWREDESNRELRFARNRIRHVVLPALEAVQPGAARRLARLAERAAEAEAAWRELAGDAARDVVIQRDETGFTLARDRLLGYHPQIRARVLRLLLHQLGSRPDRAGTRAGTEFISSGSSGARIDLGSGVRVEREFDRILLRRVRDAAEPAEVPLVIQAAVGGAGSFAVGGHRYLAAWGAGLERAGGGHTTSFDPSSLRFPLVLRAWRPGDRIRLAYGSKKLKKLFQEKRIGRTRRMRVPVLCAADGQVLWVVGVAAARAARPQQTGELFTITVTDGGSD
jgi:tRNA(Ile)-lysidine synthase